MRAKSFRLRNYNFAEGSTNTTLAPRGKFLYLVCSGFAQIDEGPIGCMSLNVRIMGFDAMRDAQVIAEKASAGAGDNICHS